MSLPKFKKVSVSITDRINMLESVFKKKKKKALCLFLPAQSPSYYPEYTWLLEAEEYKGVKRTY